jgi:trehalose-phosphatase
VLDLPKVLPKPSGREGGPSPLPLDLLPDVVHRQPVLLCLDYDGTISEIAAEPQLARPVSGAADALRTLSAHRSRVKIALVSGRTLADLRSMLSLPPGIALAGVHGLELLDWTGQFESLGSVEGCRKDLASARAWLDRMVSAGSGFIVEDKEVALALHYRRAPRRTARCMRDSFARFITEQTSSLMARRGKMVVEALPRLATKATAVRTLWQRAGHEFKPVYFGDDLTDEDAFSELAGHGISILVGKARPSGARYRVDAPADVVHQLEALAAQLGIRANETQ